MKKQNLGGSFWELQILGENDKAPAQVPGSVYLDLLRAGKMEDPFWKDNEDQALKLMENDFVYTTDFSVEKSLLEEEMVLLRFDGLDTLAEITLNGVLLGTTNNMHRYWEYDVKQYLQLEANHLEVIFRSPTKWITEAYAKAPTKGTEDAMPGFVHLRKAHCMFGWDWGAHLPDAGIWRPVYLVGFSSARIDNVEILQNHKEGKVSLAVKVEASVVCRANSDTYCMADGSVYSRDDVCEETATGYVEKLMPIGENSPFTYTVTIQKPDGAVLSYEDAPSLIEIEQPELWWPNGYGKQPLYTVHVELLRKTTSDQDENYESVLLDRWENRIGLRTLTMDRSKNEWGENFNTTINGVQIFAMGADYIPEDHLICRVTPETTRTLLEKAVFANFNCIRVWGGGYYPSDWFYDICDELGLIVWEDFMFACGVYDLTPEFEANIVEELRQNLKRIRSHACLGIFSGNNEMESFVKTRTWVSKDSEVRDYTLMYERIFPALCEELAPQIFYWPSSPSSGGCFDDPQDPDRGDVHYWDVWHGDKPFTEYRKFYFRYLSEFGFQAFPSEKTVEAFTDDPADKNIFSYIMEKHQRNGSANGKIMNYLQQTYKYPSDFSTVVYASQLLQADGIRYGVEHFRRNRGRCMGAVYWQFNDCWPVSSWSSVDYCQRLKALHYTARRFFAPLMISCEEHGMMDGNQPLNWLPFGFKKSIRLNVASELMQDTDVVVKWQLRNAKAEILQANEYQMHVPALTSVWLDEVELPDVDIYNEYVSYQLYQDEQLISDGSVIFSYPKYFRYEDPKLTVSVDGNKITVHAASYAKNVEILNENEDLILSDNYFDLNADSKTVEILSGTADRLRIRSVYDIK